MQNEYKLNQLDEIRLEMKAKR